ncbi:hypothetical protein MTR67_048547 [Solanum verrucosum]|uniref:DUF4218 domain-containing protein n=1 Tax=Solanum verrucosum TaxID=315347 RepID=A0AAF0UYM8_SOLVR|nr:hypothetical protein MTR67_048547 [Solanum verrucosum]
MVHLYRNGFKPRYFVWIDHGESDGLDGMFYNSMPVDVYNMVAPHGQIRVEQVRIKHDRVEHDRVHEMIDDAFGVQDWNVPNAAMDSMVDLLGELVNPEFIIPKNFYQAKRLVSKLGLTLKRLYASMRSAPHMRWHREYRRPSGVLSHPSDSEALKHFDNVYPDFASEPRNVRLGLCSDGFTPFSNNASPYSCWPVFLTLYNLPPEMCMTSPYIFLSCVIPAGKLAFPYCMENSKAFTLKNGRKNSWFDCHHQFLPMDHEFRKMKNAFRKNKVESDPPPPLLIGHQIWERVSQLPKVTEASPSRLPGYGVEHNWTKQNIFWELSYWKNNLLRHNLDVMHIEKNYFDNLFNTLMDVKGKTKDNPKARMDIKECCRRKEFWLQELQNGKIVKPKASFSFTLDEKHEIIEWVKNLRMPEGYASNLGKRAYMNEGKLIGMKSHDCHVLMETLIPIAFSHLPERIWKPITEISLFFKDLCSGKLLESSLDRIKENILVTTTKLEKIFPCGFFDVMEHLPIHLVQEARLGGPVQTR